MIKFHPHPTDRSLLSEAWKMYLNNIKFIAFLYYENNFSSYFEH